MSKNTGGSAFPVNAQIESTEHPHVWPETGMTLRDYFAAKAMQAFISAHNRNGNTVSSDNGMKIIADVAYGIADAMLEARDK